MAAAGTGAVGGVLLVDQLNVSPDSIFSVWWTAFMIFIVIVGGIGTLERPIPGLFASAGVWSLPRRLWGAVTQWSAVRLFNVGYAVQGLDEGKGIGLDQNAGGYRRRRAGGAAAGAVA